MHPKLVEMENPFIFGKAVEGDFFTDRVEDAIDNLLEQNRAFLQRDIEQLTELQLNFLKALANGVKEGFTKKDVLKKYRLESSANVQGIKKALVAKDIIDTTEKEILFNDSLLKLWIQRNIILE